jgi:hypothetical protein
MKKIGSLFFTAVVAIILLNIESCQSSKTSAGKLLQFNLEKGKLYDYEMVMDLNQGMLGQSNKISMMTGYTVYVTDDDGKIITLTLMYNDFKMNMKMMGMEIDVDTDKPVPAMTEEDIKNNPMNLVNKVFSNIKGKKFTMKVNREGKVLEVSGFDEIAAAMADSISVSEELRQRMEESVKQQFNDENIKEQFGQIFFVFPGKEVNAGDSWEKTYETGGKMPSKRITTYTVKQIEGNYITLGTKTRIESGSNDIKMEGDQTGDMMINGKTGLVVNADFTYDIDATINGMTLKMNGKSKTKGTAR